MTKKEYALLFASDVRRMPHMKYRFAVIVNLRRQLKKLHYGSNETQI